MKIKIRTRFTQRVIHTIEAESLRDAVIRLVAYRADLRDADLLGADLRGADLRDADLLGADLRVADLRDADLRYADLRYADLLGADLRGADLRDADLRYADLRGAVQEELSDDEYLKFRDEYRQRNPDVPIVPLLDSTICKIVNSGEGKLDMGDWHQCKTTHCRAGWAIHLAGEKGYALEEKYGPERAGGMIYRASTGRWPDFFASTDVALKDICAWGEKETLAQESTTWLTPSQPTSYTKRG